MKIGIVRATVALVVFTLGAVVAQAQERPPDVVRRLMEQKAPPAPLFVPGEVIVRWHPRASPASTRSSPSTAPRSAATPTRF